MTRLPLELAYIIIEEAQYRDCLPCCKWLRNYALVCRDWCTYSQRLLFQRITLLGGSKQCERLVAALSGSHSNDLKHTRYLRNCVRTLEIRTMDHQPIYIDAILLCPKLFELDVRLCHAWFRPEMLDRLQHEGPKIQALHIRSAYYKPMYQLCEAFSTIQYLSLDARSTRSDCTSFTPSWKLKELRLLSIPQVAPVLIEWALSSPNAQEHLEILHLNVPAPPPLFSELNFTKIRSLHVREINVEDLQRLGNLEEIAFRVFPPSREVLDALPLTVHHILLPSIVECLDEVLEGLRAYQARSSGSLHWLTYTRLSPNACSVKQKDVKSLRVFCHLNDIQFTLMDPPYGTVPGEIEPLGGTAELPRRLPISSRRRKLPTVLDCDEDTVSGKRTIMRRFITFAKDSAARLTMSGVSEQ
ncbi:hypothetical protein C8Q75DRAFT_865216 [Abortiporus biennis]|nr:hypothetical protein C8Q75DRAFT_865216 [Abortiporus biennis]